MSRATRRTSTKNVAARRKKLLDNLIPPRFQHGIAFHKGITNEFPLNSAKHEDSDWTARKIKRKLRLAQLQMKDE